MLPPLSDNLGSKKLQLLMPVVVVPSALSAWQSAMLELKKVNAIQVRCAGKKDMFVVEVFPARSDSTLANYEAIANSLQLQRPTVRIERTLLEFVQLRDKIYEIAHEAHRGKPCDLCADCLELIVFGANPDGFIVGLLGGKRLKRSVMKFIVGLLRVTVHRICTSTRGCCSGHTLIPQAVHAFLFISTNHDV
ncbi:unnamed protein product [Peronospora belbahrii]|uniref:Uncharacterized protein n=1 Tax=Peronospora belbahrii TaxID=622444 RepID=A0ABN8CU24_9STRA|nr:unnamed protein product [Peronospora belbahrii]